MSLYIGALLKRGLNKGEMRDVVSPLMEEAMMYSSVVGVELLYGINEAYNEINWEGAERVKVLMGIR
jgi:hypothetical protein